MAYLDLSRDSWDFWKIPVPGSMWIFSLRPLKAKSRQELFLKNKHKGGLAKFCFEIGNLFELEVKWNINISETNEVTLNKGKTKGILPIRCSSALIQSSYQQNIFRKHYLLCNFLKLNSGNYAVCGGERIFSHLNASPKLRPHISNREDSRKAIQEARKCFLGCIHKIGCYPVAPLLVPATKGHYSPASNVKSAI